MKEEKRLLEKGLESLGKKIKDAEKFISTFGAKARMASRAQSKQKAVDTLVEEEDLLKDQLAQVEGYSFNLRFSFRMGSQGSKFPLVAENVKFRYSNNSPWILQNIHLDFKRGQKVAIIGDNGAGKTTLLNVLSEKLNATEGEIKYGHGVETGYFGQHQLEELLLDQNLLDALFYATFNYGSTKVVADTLCGLLMAAGALFLAAPYPFFTDRKIFSPKVLQMLVGLSVLAILDGFFHLGKSNMGPQSWELYLFSYPIRCLISGADRFNCGADSSVGFTLFSKSRNFSHVVDAFSHARGRLA